MLDAIKIKIIFLKFLIIKPAVNAVNTSGAPLELIFFQKLKFNFFITNLN